VANPGERFRSETFDMHRNPWSSTGIVARTSFLLIGMAALTGLPGCGAGSGAVASTAPAPPYPRSACPERLAIGPLDHGTTGETRLSLENPHDRAIEVSAIEVSCPCLKVSPGRFRLEPRSSQSLILRFDPQEEPEFAGRLAVKVAALSAQGQEVFQTTVGITVRPSRAVGAEEAR
jgi:hypothetical protein